MATSRYSYLRQYAPYVSPYNVDVIKDVMVYKQGRVDANRARMYEQIDYLMGQELAKPQDREYLRTRMSGTIARINEQFDGVDLSSDGVTRAIQGEISSVLDDKVINAIAGTREYQNLIRQIEDIRTNKPQYYSSINEYVASMPYFNWMNDGKVGSRLGALHYTPYYDYRTALNERIQKFREDNKGRKFPIQQTVNGNPTGAMIYVTEDQMSDSQIRSYIAANLDERMRQQMQIEATYLASTNPVFHSVDNMRSYFNDYMKRFGYQKSALNEQKEAAASNPYGSQYIDQQIDDLKILEASTRKRINDIVSSGNPVNAAMFAIESGLMDSMADTWKYNNTSYEYKKDEVYFAQQQEARDQKRFELESAETVANTKLINERLGLIRAQADKAALEAQWMREHPGQSYPNGDGSSNDPNGKNNPGATHPVGPTVVNRGAEGGSRNMNDVVNENISNASKNRKLAYLQLWNSIPEDKRRGMLQAMRDDSSKNPGVYAGLNEQEALYKWMERNGGVKIGQMNKGDKNSVAIYNAYKSVQSAESYSDGVKNTLDVVVDNALNQFNSISENSDISNVINSNDVFDENIPIETRKAMVLLTSAIVGNSGFNVQNIREKLGIIGAQSAASLVATHNLLAAIATGAAAAAGIYGNNRLKRGRNLIKYAIDNNQTAVTSSIIAASRMLGDRSFNLEDYISVNEDGEMSIVGESENEPTVVKLLRVIDRNPLYAISMYDKIGDSVYEGGFSENAISRTIGENESSFSINNFIWSKDAPSNSDENQQFRALRDIVASKVTIDGNAVKIDDIDTVQLISEPNGSGGFSRRLAVTSDGKLSSEYEVSDDELIRSGINPSTPPRMHRVDNYESDFHDCSFVDGNTSEGFAYDAHISSSAGLGLRRISSIQDVLEDTETLARSRTSYMTKDDQDEFVRTCSMLVYASDFIDVRLKGVNDRGRKYVEVNFYDKETVDSSNPKKIFSHFIEMEGPTSDWVDYYNEILNEAPQYYYLLTLTSAIDKMAIDMRKAYNEGSGVPTVVGNLFQKIYGFASRKLMEVNSRNRSNSDNEEEN